MEKDRVVLIELQKTWLNTETLRFRQYLGAQYSNKNNIREADEKGFAYPMVAVYLLGHKVGNIKEPIVYVNHDVFDYNGNIVKEGSEEPFVESLTHNSIIVQIPLLHGNVNNRLEKVLSVFDQTQVEGNTQQVLKIDEDTAIMQRDKILKEQEEQLSQQNEQLSQQSEQLSQQSEQLSLKDEQLRNMAKVLFDKGMTEEQISSMTGIDIENVVKLLK